MSDCQIALLLSFTQAVISQTLLRLGVAARNWTYPPIAVLLHEKERVHTIKRLGASSTAQGQRVHTHAHTSSSVHLVLADVVQVQAKGLEPFYRHSKSSIGEVTSLMPDFTLDLRAAGRLAVDGRRWPPTPQPTQAQGVRWKMVDGRRPRYVVRWTCDGRSLLARPNWASSVQHT